jgi:hypothetical protein
VVSHQPGQLLRRGPQDFRVRGRDVGRSTKKFSEMLDAKLLGADKFSDSDFLLGVKVPLVCTAHEIVIDGGWTTQ